VKRLRGRITALAALATATSLLGMLAPADIAGAATTQKVLGIVQITTTDLSTVQATQGATKAAKAAGWSVLVANAQGEPSKAIAAMDDFVNRHVTAIMTTVFESTTLEAGIKAAKAAHIPVVSMAGGLAPGIAAAVDANAGDVVAKALIKAMGGGSKGSILDFTYHPGLPCLLRGNAFNTVLSSHPGIKVTRHEINIQNVASDSESTASGWLQTKPTTPLGIFGCYDDPAVAAISALKAQGYKPGQVKVFGFNAEAPALAAIKTGWMTGSMYFDSVGAGTTVFATIRKVLSAGSSWHQEELQIPHLLVVKSNLAAFEKSHS
jgi:ABC-type sugar transport system substrate-binding protein